MSYLNTSGGESYAGPYFCALFLLKGRILVLNFLIHTIESMIARVDPEHIAPQMVGPKLLKALHNLAHFDLESEAGAMSPLLLKAIRQSDTEVIEFSSSGVVKYPSA